mgnify:CR=1 FL=1
MGRRRVGRWGWLCAVGLVALVFAWACQGVRAAGATGPVRVLSVRGVINPLIAQYVERNLGRTDARLYVILLDTPGGSDASMRRVVQAILGSPVPVAVFVAPQGARAGSAGVFVAMAGHVAAMAPGSSIGAAHPVGGQGQDITGDLGMKVTNDAAAWARSIAELRGRNAEWAEQAVRSSNSCTAQDAVGMHIVDLLATDLDDLLGRLEGRTVVMSSGQVVLQLAGAPREHVSMTLLERFLHILIDPNIAYLMMTIGMLAIVIELFHPGAVVPAVTGAICLILAFIAFENLPLNWGGVALIALALIFFVLDIKVTGFALSVGGAFAFVLGSLILFSPFGPRSPALPAVHVNAWMIVAMTAITVGLFVFAVGAGLRAQRLPVAVSVREVVGARGVAVSVLNPLGVVRSQGEEWSAVTDGPPIEAGEAVEVLRLEGNTAIVRRVGPVPSEEGKPC